MANDNHELGGFTEPELDDPREALRSYPDTALFGELIMRAQERAVSDKQRHETAVATMRQMAQAFVSEAHGHGIMGESIGYLGMGQETKVYRIRRGNSTNFGGRSLNKMIDSKQHGRTASPEIVIDSEGRFRLLIAQNAGLSGHLLSEKLHWKPLEDQDILEPGSDYDHDGIAMLVSGIEDAIERYTAWPSPVGN